MHESAPSARRRELQKLLVVACAIAHGEGIGQSLSDLVELVLERGLPARVERERLRDERLKEAAEDG